MSYNVPDDWGMYWYTCKNGHRYHASENYCDRCPEELVEEPVKEEEADEE